MRSRRAVLRALAATTIIATRANAADPGADPFAREFAEPVLELIRLLNKAADLEHAALLQYTYAGFSLKPGYQSIGDLDASGMTTNLLGLAIDRMMHFGTVNRLLIALGAPPRLAPPLFPFVSDAYPFPFRLEPLSYRTLAQFIYREAPGAFFADADAGDAKLKATVCGLLGVPPRRGHGVYSAIASVAGEIHAADLPDMRRWIITARYLEERGAGERLEFLTSVFLGTNPAFLGHDDVWRLPASDPLYPAYAITADEPGPIPLALTRLGNLQYATVLSLLDLYFRQHLSVYRSVAIAHMTGPMRSIGKYLPSLGYGLTFEPIDVPDSSVLPFKRLLSFTLALLREGQAFAESLGPRLPPDYPLSINKETMARLEETTSRPIH